MGRWNNAWNIFYLHHFHRLLLFDHGIIFARLQLPLYDPPIRILMMERKNPVKLKNIFTKEALSFIREKWPSKRY
jgi:hypothetical protein